MKRLSMIMVCVLAMMAACLSAKAQEVTITLYPGNTWISYPRSEMLDINTALGDFVPAEGDIIKSQFTSSTYRNGYWRGGVTHFMPGWGYMYYSNRTEVVSFVFGETAPQLTVTTAEPMEITAISAISGGSLTSSDGSYIVVLEKGICWATHPNPTVMNDFHTENGGGINSFTAEMTDLELNAVYYLRAYAVTESGTTYGEEMNFTTRDGIPVVATDSVTDIWSNAAICCGEVTDNGGLDVIARGVCWSTNPNPTLSGNYTTDGAGTGSFTSSITNLEVSTTYYVRAYATTNAGTAYGNELSFTTRYPPMGAIDGKFTVNASGDQVYFSQGNLQYIGSASTPYWKFADNQWDVLGTTTGQNSSDQNVDRDLFGWGTSSWNNGNVYYQPYDTQNNGNSSQGYGYGPTDGTSYTNNLAGTYANADWGVYNPISNGGNQANQWRTLTAPEWGYIFSTRTTSSGIRYAKAKVNDVNGVILLPDDWSSDTYSLSNTNSPDASFSTNTISASQWNTLEQAGAVFLPAAGGRDGTSVNNVGSSGYYWSASCRNNYRAYYVNFYGSYLYTIDDIYRYGGESVRLVRVAEN